MRLWLTRSPWRLCAAWAVIAGALASGGLALPSRDWVRLLLLVFLADPAWGSLWTVLAERRRDALDDSIPLAAPALPYLLPGSPAARLLGWAESDLSLMTAWRLGLPGLLAAGAVSLILGREAVITTGLAILFCLVGWVTRRLNGQPNGWAQAMLTMGLPWALGYVAYAPVSGSAAALALAFVLWQRAALGIEQGGRLAWPMLAVSQIIALGVLVSAHLPMWAGGLALVIAPTWWMAGSLRNGDRSPALLERVQKWWWLALLLSALALGSLAA